MAAAAEAAPLRNEWLVHLEPGGGAAPSAAHADCSQAVHTAGATPATQAGSAGRRKKCTTGGIVLPDADHRSD